ncbi:MAG: zinc-ribbon domain-containing protein [Deltaproteobacteria bacterium]|nr:zinc-ribbon domain-containing protein [Deltaproteobacteria bacterium]
MTNRFCPNCGEQVLNDDLFCGSCGSSLKKDTSSPIQKEPVSKPAYEDQNKKDLKPSEAIGQKLKNTLKRLFTTKPNIKIVAIIIAALILTFGTLALYFILKDEYRPGFVTALAFHPSGNVLATGGPDKSIRFWDIQTRKELSAISDSFAVYAIAFSPDGEKLAAGRYDTIKVYTYSGHKLLQELKGHSSIVIALMFSPDNKRLYSIDETMSLKVWDIETGKYLGGLKGKKDKIASAALSPDIQYYAYSPYLSKRIHVLRTRNMSLVRSIKTPDYSSEALTFYPKGPLVGGVSYKDIKFWSVKSGYNKGQITFCCNGIQSLAIDPDGKFIAAGLADGKIEIRIAKNGKLQTTLFHYSFFSKIFFGNPN